MIWRSCKIIVGYVPQFFEIIISRIMSIYARTSAYIYNIIYIVYINAGLWSYMHVLSFDIRMHLRICDPIRVRPTITTSTITIIFFWMRSFFCSYPRCTACTAHNRMSEIHGWRHIRADSSYLICQLHNLAGIKSLKLSCSSSSRKRPRFD